MKEVNKEYIEKLILITKELNNLVNRTRDNNDLSYATEISTKFNYLVGYITALEK